MILKANFENSSSILRADYDVLMSTLKVYFRSGGIYDYLEVPQELFDSLQSADSAGRFFVANIKNSFQAFRVS